MDEEKLAQLMELINSKKLRELKYEFEDMEEADIAAFIEELNPEQALIVFRLLQKDVSSDVFAYLPPETQELIINGIGDTELKAIIEDLSADDAADVVEEMPANLVKRILKNATPETRALINQMLKYPENSAGSIMTSEYISLKKSMTVAQAFAYIRANGIDKETIYTCYVTDDKRVLLGIVTLKDLLMNPYGTIIEDIMDDNLITVSTNDDREEVAAVLNHYDFISVPVVDKEFRLVGIVTIDDAADALEEEVTEDIEKMAAIVPQEKPYLKQSTFEIWKSRIPWLLLLMISATFTGMIITSFEDALAKYVVLTAYIPMLMDTGGNSGSQASVTVIRGLSLKEVEFGDIFRVIWKEMRVALMCGATLAVCNFIKLILFDKLAIIVALTICLTLIVTIFCAKMVGCTLPLFAAKMGFDPAVMASPFITTIVDAISLLVYFRFAVMLLHI